ncbi:YbaB/EbfC family nucleoid-associated protein [Nocardia wallacei]|uniref:YbaB/EbfC family nucleoid-associated protein n=1 Tax=Nocardia wallacei TaxID=480035 RepID=UPI002455C4D4|nr:YbaB/EbfC family nucleoid-associated protein [Nocardia wallacei]
MMDWFDDIVDDIERHQTELRLSYRRLWETMRVQSVSPDGMVTVTVDAVGSIIDVRFDADIGHSTFDELRCSICRAAHEAARIARQHAKALITLAASTLGDAINFLPGAQGLLDDELG